jgi:tetratricopeptide (TPR) repeat protein
VADSARIEDLRRRVRKDPASIAFAQLAEELRRAGAFQEAVDTCRAGLVSHPSYLSARVTLGRALIGLNELELAQTELERVLASAADNLAARRGLGEICSRQGRLEQALAHYQSASTLAPNDPDLEETVAHLSRRVELARADQPVAVSFESPVATPADPEQDRAIRTVEALETWLNAINVARADRRA